MMQKLLCIALLVLVSLFGNGQNLEWSAAFDSINIYSSPRVVDLTGDSILDVVVGAGMEGETHHTGVIALNGTDGSLIWKAPANNQVYTSALFLDVSADGVPDVFIGGRGAVFMALDGMSGNIIWEFWPDTAQDPTAAGWYNFYNPQWIPDQDGDALADLLITNGGDANATAWDSLRPPGHLMVLSSATGSILAAQPVPDGHETYCSPLLLDLAGDGTTSIVFGTGGETVRGRFWEVTLAELLAGDISQARILASDSVKGFVVPPSIAYLNADEIPDLILPAFGGRIMALDGATRQPLWSHSFPGYECYVSPTLGNFTGDDTPDVFTIIARGQWSFYAEYVKLLIDGGTGQVVWTDTSNIYQLAQVNAFDWNDDGWDEIIGLHNWDDGFAQVEFQNVFRVFDFHQAQTTDFGTQRNGLMLFSTPQVADLDHDGQLEMVFAYNPDLNSWAGNNGSAIARINLPVSAGHLAWSGYLGNAADGWYRVPELTTLGPAQSATRNRLILFPNPANETVQLGGLLPDMQHEITVWNAQGQLVQRVLNKRVLSVSDLPAGLYFVVVSQDGKQASATLVVE